MNSWQFIQDKIDASVDVMLLYVLESKGSSPGRQGFNMAVAADGNFFGTIGGGIMEHKFVEMAKARLMEKEDAGGLYKQVHDKAAAKNQSGMICSGEQTIFLYQVQKSDAPFIKLLLDSLSINRNGTLQLSHHGLSFNAAIPAENFYFKQEDEERFLFIEKTGFKNTLHIVGGGHCALALSRMMSNMDFYIHVYDERDGLNTMNANSFAHERHLLGSYEDLKTLIQDGTNVYVVVMTFGYRSDDIAMKALMTKQFKYLGLLGSKKKIEKMAADYREQKLDESMLKQVRAPIGIQIKSQTADEIAVSIAAEIIAVKNKDQ